MRRGVSSGLYVVSFCRSFIVDFVLRDSSDYRVGVECDGKKFHDASRDEWRDAMIIGENHLDAIYRLRGSDINYYIEDVLYLIAELEPSLFSPRAASNLKVLASPEVKEICKGHDRDIYLIHYKNEDDIGGSMLRHVVVLFPRASVGFGKLHTGMQFQSAAASWMRSWLTSVTAKKQQINRVGSIDS
jgi:hypothetical protein